MAKCVGCGLQVNGGILEVDVCTNGGIVCKPDGSTGCTEGGLAVKLCNTGGIVYDTSCTDQFGSSGGLKINITSDSPNPILGCGLAGVDGKIQFKFDTTTCGTEQKSLLKCDDTNGISAKHINSIAGNSGVCGANATTPSRAYNFLLPPSSFADLAAAPTLNVGQYDFHTDTFTVGPECTDVTQCWAGNTIWDMGGVNFDLAANSLVRVVAEINQGYDNTPVSFGASPLQRMTFDTTGNVAGKRSQFDFQSHDTTWQIVCGGQKFLFQMRMRVIVVKGSCIVTQFGAIWEINWHYSHNGSTGCANP